MDIEYTNKYHPIIKFYFRINDFLLKYIIIIIEYL